MVVTLGESLTISGRWQTGFTVETTSSSSIGIGAEDDASGLGVGAGDVELVGGDAFGFVEDADDVAIVLAGVAEDVGDDRGAVDLAQLRAAFWR